MGDGPHCLPSGGPPPAGTRYLGAKEGKRFAFDPLNFADDETLAFLWEKAYIVALFTPFLLACFYILLGQPDLPVLPFDPFAPVGQAAGAALWVSGQGMKLTFDIWNIFCETIGGFAMGAVLRY